MRMFSFTQFTGFVFATIFGLMSNRAIAVCPFNADQQGAAGGAGTTDGLLFIRYALGLTMGASLTANAAQNNATDTTVVNYIVNNKTALDIDGDDAFTAYDAVHIARYLLGFRGAALLGTLTQPDFVKRSGGVALQRFIDGGCTGTNDLADPRVAVWNAMNAQLALGTTAGINGAKQYMTDTAVSNFETAMNAIRTDLPTLVASYSQIISRTVGTDYAEYWVSRPIPGSTSGGREVFVITFLLMFDGTWRVDSM